MPKPKTYMDPRAHNASVAEMAREMAQRKKEVPSWSFKHYSFVLRVLNRFRDLRAP